MADRQLGPGEQQQRHSRASIAWWLTQYDTEREQVDRKARRRKSDRHRPNPLWLWRAYVEARGAGMRRDVLGAAFELVGLLTAATPASPQDRARVDLYRPDGQRAGYAIVDRESRRADFYDPASRRTGYGQVDATGRVERFDLKGRREPVTVVPPTGRQTR